MNVSCYQGYCTQPDFLSQSFNRAALNSDSLTVSVKISPLGILLHEGIPDWRKVCTTAWYASWWINHLWDRLFLASPCDRREGECSPERQPFWKPRGHMSWVRFEWRCLENDKMWQTFASECQWGSNLCSCTLDVCSLREECKAESAFFNNNVLDGLYPLWKSPDRVPSLWLATGKKV